MNLDLKKFKKVSSNKTHTIFKHPEGHLIHVAHMSLPKTQKLGLRSLETFSEGGRVRPHPTPVPTPSQELIPITQDPERAKKLQDSFRNATAYAEGGKVEQPSLWDTLTTPIPPTSLGRESLNVISNHLTPETVTLDDQPSAPPAGFEEGQRMPISSAPGVVGPVKTFEPIKKGYDLSPPAPIDPEADPLGANEMEKYYRTGYEQEQQGIQQEAQGLANQGEAKAAAGQELLEQQKTIQEHYQDEVNSLNQERQAFISDIQNAHIDPEHYISNMSTGQRVMTTIGLILGGLGSGGDPNKNPALQMLNKNIDRDIEAQKEQIGVKKTLLDANYKQFNNMHDATLATHAMIKDMLANRLDIEANKASSPIVKARALQAGGKLRMDASTTFGQLAARRTLAKGMKNGKVNPGMAIQALVPKEMHGEAMKELGIQTQLDEADSQITQLLSKAHEASRFGKLGSLPWTSNSKLLAEVEARIMSIAISNWKGNPTETEVKKLVKPYLSGMTDNPQDLARRVKGLQDMIHANSKGTPILDTYGLSRLKAKPPVRNTNAPRH